MKHERLRKARLSWQTLVMFTIGRAVLEPGWSWEKCVKPIVITDSCQARILSTLYLVELR